MAIEQGVSVKLTFGTETVEYTLLPIPEQDYKADLKAFSLRTKHGESEIAVAYDQMIRSIAEFLRDANGNRVSVETVRGWPARTIESLGARLRKISGIKQG
jgi:hypothetical protein